MGLLKWLFTKPGTKWSAGMGIFFASWSMMTWFPFSLFWGQMHYRDEELHRTLLWIFGISWFFASCFIFALYTNITRLSERVDELEQELKSQRSAPAGD